MIICRDLNQGERGVTALEGEPSNRHYLCPAENRLRRLQEAGQSQCGEDPG